MRLRGLLELPAGREGDLATEPRRHRRCRTVMRRTLVTGAATLVLLIMTALPATAAVAKGGWATSTLDHVPQPAAGVASTGAVAVPDAEREAVVADFLASPEAAKATGPVSSVSATITSCRPVNHSATCACTLGLVM